MLPAFALIVIILAVVLVARGFDVRLVLFLAALLLGILAGDIAPILREFLFTLSNEKFVVPICSAMGFAYVLRQTGCDQHLVRLLMAPVQRVKPLAIPGTIAVGFIVNIPIISQTSTAVCLGPVVVPLLRALGYSPLTIGATLLLGASIGGELLNPGAPELLTVSEKTKVDTRELVNAIAKPLMVTTIVGTLVFWLLTEWRERKREVVKDETPLDSGPINPIKALVPLVPLIFLFVTGPPFHFAPIPQRYLIPYPSVEQSHMAVGGAMAIAAEGKQDSRSGSRLIGLAMLAGVAAAAIVSPKNLKTSMSEFFSGAGYGFTHIVSLIVVANAFGKGIELAGLAKWLGQIIQNEARLLTPLAAGVPCLFAAICGSGMATTQSLYGFFFSPANQAGDAVGIGSVVSIASAAGRTMSPVAAVVMMCGTLTNCKPWDLSKRVAVPLLAGLMAMVLAKMLGWI